MKKRLFTIGGVAALLLICSCNGASRMGPAECYQHGQELLKKGKKAEAYRYFVAAAKKDTAAPQYEYAAAVAAPDRNKAFVHATNAWKGGAKNSAVLGLLASLSLQTNSEQRLLYTLSLYNEMPDSLRTLELRGDIFFQFGAADSSIRLWRSAFESQPSPQLLDKIADAYGQTSRPLKAIEYLEAPRARALLDARGYALLATSYGLIDSFARADSVYAEARRKGRFDILSLINQSMVYLAAGNNAAAEAVLSEALENTEPQHVSSRRDARGLLMLVYASRRDTSRIAGLAAQVNGEGKYDKSERMFLDGALQIVKGDTAGREKVTVAGRMLSGTAAVRAVMARQELVARRYNDALKLYSTLPMLLTHVPQVALEIALAQMGMGNDDMALMIISSLHRRHIITKESLSLFRDLALKKQLYDKASAAQAVLDKRFGSDAQVKWAGAILASRKGKLDSALTLFEALCKEYPGEERFEKAKITSLILLKQYDRAVAECSSSKVPAAVASLKARALFEQGKKQEAITVFDQALETGKNRALLVEYANFFISIGENAKAASALKEIIDSSRAGKDRKQDFHTAVILNNFAWTGLQSGLYNAGEILSAAQKAYEIAPANADILDTYASALLNAGKPAQCVALLDTCSPPLQTPNLLVSLGKAAAQIKDINKAIRAYRQALERMASDTTGNITVRKADIEAAIQRLSSDAP